MQSQNYIRPFEGNLEADVAPGENEFDTPAVVHMSLSVGVFSFVSIGRIYNIWRMKYI